MRDAKRGVFYSRGKSFLRLLSKSFSLKKRKNDGTFSVNDFCSKKIHMIVTISLAALASNDYVANPADENYWAE
jgi:hypothetical protein